MNWSQLDQSSKSYISTSDRRRRSELGQFFTPELIADFLVGWILDGEPATVFDPAVGAGAFQAALVRAGYSGSMQGCEKDEHVLAHLRNSSLRGVVEIVGGDYFRCRSSLVDAIICNPPYLRFQNFANRKMVIDALSAEYGIKFSGYLNSASAFLLKSLRQLAPGGRLAYLMPLEFLNTGYGKAVKEALVASCDFLHFIKVEDERSVFDDVLTSVGIILAVKGGAAKALHFSSIEELPNLSCSLNLSAAVRVSVADVSSSEKWGRFFEVQNERAARENLVPVSYYGRFSRGIATGANEFFVANKAQCDSRGLPEAVRSLCITRSQQLTKTVLDVADVDLMYAKGEPVVLLDLERGLGDEAVTRYIAEGEQHRYHLRYLTRSRSPWYALEKRRPPAIFLGVFSRGGYKVVLNRSGAISLTPFHGFLPKDEFDSLVPRLWMFLSSKAGRRSLDVQRRTYGGKLDKLEPNDANQAMVPNPQSLSTISDDMVLLAINAARAGRPFCPSVEEFCDGLVR